MPKARARPKSASLSWPLVLISKFWGLRSRCRTRLSWQYSIPASNWCMKDLTTVGGRILTVSMYFFRSWFINSKISMSFFSVWTTSNNWTMLGWLSSFISEISLMAVDGAPSSESSRISLIATNP
eukprot:Lithocolla_globosa_v1_NODE_6987_length_1006_cov_53.331230.p2 type:complete len:125 gc:universal NODE_6987_length_1006_cov_53.331230:539-165(-)